MYAKVFRSLWDGTLFGRPDEQLVFIFLLASANSDGCIDITPEAIAAPTGLSLERVRAALQALEAPDSRSRSPHASGARLERIDDHREWGWLITNYQHYRRYRDQDTIRAETRERVRRHREKKRSVTHGNGSLRQGEGEEEVTNQNLLSADADSIIPTSAKKKNRSFPNETPEFVEAYTYWPRHVKRGKALEAFNRAVLDPLVTMHADGVARLVDSIKEWADHYKQTVDSPEFIPHFSSFLNARTYADLPPTSEAVNARR